MTTEPDGQPDDAPVVIHRTGEPGGHYIVVDGRRWNISGGGPGTENADFGYELHHVGDTPEDDVSVDGFFRFSDIRAEARAEVRAALEWSEHEKQTRREQTEN